MAEVKSASVEDTWTRRDLPVLEVIVEGFTDPERYMMRIQEVVAACGLPEREVKAAAGSMGLIVYRGSPPPRRSNLPADRHERNCARTAGRLTAL
jgi:hypothetical protein